jgi:ATP/maltotriose-dependent transcriptional regulator MalT
LKKTSWYKDQQDLNCPGNEIPVPESIKDAILQRIENLSLNARNFIEAASILGVEFDPDAAAKLAGNEPGIDELFDKKLLVETASGKVNFRHILIKEAIRGGIPWSRRRSLHRQAAIYFEEQNYPPEIIAEHWLSANDNDMAKEALIRSIETSCNLHAFNDAAEKANLVLKIWPEHRDEGNRIKILFRYAHCSQINGKPDEALKALSEITNSTHFELNRTFSAEVYKLQATVYGLKGIWDQAIQARINAAESYMDAGNYAESSREFLIAAGRSSAMLNLEKSLQTAEYAVKMAEEAGRNDLKARALGLYGNVLSMKGKFKAGQDIVRQALNIALQSKDPEAASEVYRRLASTLEYASDYSAAKEAYLSAYDYCVSTGENVNAQVCLGCMSYIFYQTGDWKSSIDICRKVITTADSPESSKAVAYGISGFIHVLRGEIKSAEKNLKISLDMAKRYSIISLEMGAMWGFALLAEDSGDVKLTAQIYDQIINRWYETQDQHDVIQIIMWAAEFFAVNNMVKENAKCIEIIAQIASLTGNTEAMSALAFALAEASFMNKNFTEARNQYEQALLHMEKLTVPVEQMRVEYRLGCCLIQLDKKEEAVLMLNRAYRTARNLSMRPFASAISKILQDIGSSAEESRKPDSYLRADSAGLTKRQKEILVMVSQGLTNKEISSKIFLSTRTVDMHVSNILQRFNCRTRTEAVSKAKELQIL